MKTHPLFRFTKHLVSHRWQVNQHFSPAAMQRIEDAIAHSEKNHQGEICFVVEAGLHPYEVINHKTPQKRAIELFSRFHVWDTEFNNGVLIYLLLADRDVEVVADRGIHQHVGHDVWQVICNEMEAFFKRGEFEAGVLRGIEQIGAQLEKHFPLHKAASKSKPKTTPKTRKKKSNEISNKPIII